MLGYLEKNDWWTPINHFNTKREGKKQRKRSDICVSDERNYNREIEKKYMFDMDGKKLIIQV